MLNIIFQRQFEKDIKKIKKRGKEFEKLKNIMTLLIKKKPLPIKNLNHKLKGNFKGYWECHIESDWLLIYKKTSIEIIFIRTGSHSDLF